MNAILNYHRICSDNVFTKPNDELVVSESKFREQLIFLQKNYNIVSLDGLLSFENKNKSNVSITFDDGYKDNLTYALPILNELKIPATIYIITKFYEKEGSIWWWELQDYIWENSQNIQLLSPNGTKNPYYLDLGWKELPNSPNNIDLPDHKTKWSTTSNLLVPNNPVTLSWTNDQMITFNTHIVIDDD